MALTLYEADVIVKRALEVGHKNSLKPLTVAVLDAGGSLMAFAREDGASLYRERIARGKAMAALGLGMDSGLLLPIAKARPEFMNAAYAAAGGELIPVAGGVLVLDASSRVIGAVGISGDLSEKDETCAIEGIRAAGRECKALVEGTPLFIKAHL